MRLVISSQLFVALRHGIVMLAALAACICNRLAADEFTESDSIAPFTQVAQLLAAHCLECHSSVDPSGGLDLSTHNGWQKGGDSGPTAPADSPLEGSVWQWVSDDSMPKDRSPLSAEEKTLLSDWLTSGASWKEGAIDPRRFTVKGRAGFDWWAFQPVKRPHVPAIVSSGNAIDQFVAAKLLESKIVPVGRAGGRELLRRLSFDLIGLPPIPEKVSDVVKNANDIRKFDSIYRESVESMLASPHFGERWARHWLDVVRFGETQGFERNRIRENAWQYRDWVVRAINADLPYDEFVRLQIAGDVLRPNNFEAAMATGYHVCGTWDQVGHLEGSPPMQAVARADHLEDLVGNFGQSFLGLTLQCARCHDHKYDPVSQREYYRFVALLGGIHQRKEERRGLRYVLDETKHMELLQELDRAKGELETIRASLTRKYQRDQDDKVTVDPTLLLGYSFTTDNRHPSAVTLTGELKDVHDLNLVVQETGAWTSVATASELSNRLQSGNGFALEIWFQPSAKLQKGPARIVTISNGPSTRNLTLGQLEDHLELRLRTSSSDQNGLPGLSTPPATIDLKEHYVVVNCLVDNRIQIWLDGALLAEKEAETNLDGWDKDFKIGVGDEIGGGRQWKGILNGIAFYANPLDADTISSHYARGASTIISSSFSLESAPLTERERSSLETTKRHVKHLESELKKVVFDGDAHVPFLESVGPVHILRRGDVRLPTVEVTPSGLDVFESFGLSASLGLDTGSDESQRRVALSQWVTDPRNPLTPRVIVNRLWHHHFGQGIVDTPSDFGFSGGPPSHLELLDWLAAELVSPQVEAFPGEKLTPWGLKHIHRLIVYSETYQRATRDNNVDNQKRGDPKNRLLWCYPVRRLDGESIRDAALFASGLLDTSLGGPSYRDVVVQEKNNTEFLVPTELTEGQSHRRTLYRLWARSGSNPLLSALDCPEPSVATPRRSETLTPLQALATMNNDLFLLCAKNLASRLIKDTPELPERQIVDAFQRTLQRSPTEDEINESLGFISMHGLEAFCHVLLNTNEFIYLD